MAFRELKWFYRPHAAEVYNRTHKYTQTSHTHINIHSHTHVHTNVHTQVSSLMKKRFRDDDKMLPSSRETLQRITTYLEQLRRLQECIHRYLIAPESLLTRVDEECQRQSYCRCFLVEIYHLRGALETELRRSVFCKIIIYRI